MIDISFLYMIFVMVSSIIFLVIVLLELEKKERVWKNFKLQAASLFFFLLLVGYFNYFHERPYFVQLAYFIFSLLFFLIVRKEYGLVKKR